MFCQKCGKENSEGAMFCAHCGINIENVALSKHAAPMASGVDDPMTFSKAISTCFSKFFNFQGRASRPEYWWFYLFTVLLSWGSMLIDSSHVISMLLNLVFFFPAIAAATRRLHDTNRSGWWQLIAFTIIGIIPLIVWMASKGNDQENQYGSSDQENQVGSPV